MCSGRAIVSCLAFLCIIFNAAVYTNGTHIMKINSSSIAAVANSANSSQHGSGESKAPSNESDKRSFFPPDLHRVFLAINVLPDGLCRNDSRALLEAVASHEEWGLKMFDSSPKFPVGLLYGSYYQLGNFDECVSLTSPLIEMDHNIQGQYCLADIVLDRSSKANERVARSHNRYQNYQTTSRNKFNNTLRWAVCVPSSCSPLEVEQFLRELLRIAINHQPVTIQVSDRNCYYQKSVPLNSLEILFGCFIGIFLAVVVLATIYHLLRIYNKTKTLNYITNVQNKARMEVCHNVVLSFSLVKNVGKLFHVGKSSDLNLDCIFGIRCLSMMLVVGSHSLLFILRGPVLNEGFYLKSVQKPENAIMLNHPLLVDTFLFLSGFLMCRMFILELDKRKGKINFLVPYIGRYVRLTPSYFVVIAFYCTLLVRIDDGPLWKSATAAERDRCISSWWSNLLYINNYVNTDQICMFQSWYLAADTHMFFVAPFIIHPLWKWPKFGKILLGVITVITALVPFAVTYIYELDPDIMAYPVEMGDITLNYYYKFAYIKTHMRAISYCIGLIAGYIVHRVQSSNTKLSAGLVRISWIFAAIFGISSVYSVTIFYLPNHSYSALESATYAALHKISWSVSMAWVVIACVTNNGGPVNKFLSWAPFIPLGRLTYCAYLVNGLVELHAYGTLRTPIYMNVFNMTSLAFVHILLTFAAGFLLCIFFESPIHNLEKLLLSKDKRQQTNSRQQQIVANVKL